ncbi:MAG: histidine phosphatase family protein [Actinomycetota bacterium]
MILFLLRHALTPITGKKLTGWLPGISLSEEGISQAKQAAARMADVPFSAVYSSPLERCVETAEFVSAACKKKVQKIEGLGEIRYGEWQGKSMASLYKSRAWKQLKARPADFRFPGGETIREAQVRGMTEIEKLRSKHKEQAILVCSHADMIRVLVAGYLGLPLDLYDRISIGPATTTVLHMTETVSRVLKMADSGSFEDIISRMKT